MAKTTASILLLTAHGIDVYSWQKDSLVPMGSHRADSQGLAEFDRCLDGLAGVPVYLVADVIEEDFRLEPVVHVLGKDRKILLERKLTQFFRTTAYRSARVQDREKSGRRDDRVLFSALTNPEQIDLWVDRLLAQMIQVKGIVSVPQLMECYAGFLRLDHIPHLLLVNLERANGIRQTYLCNGTLRFSRLLPSTAIKPDNLALTIRNECSHTRQYLERMKLLPHDQPLDIHIHVPDGFGEQLFGQLTDSILLRFQLQETSLVGAELGIDPDLAGKQGSVFLSLLSTLQSGKLNNTYGPVSVRRYHRLHRLRRQVIAGSVLLFTAALLVGGHLAFEGISNRVEQARIEQEILRLEQRVQHVRQQMTPTAIPPGMLRTAVDSIDRIRLQAVPPMETMAWISRAMALCPDIRLQQIHWQLTASQPAAPLSPAHPQDMQAQQATVAIPPLMPVLLAGKAAVVITLGGIVHPAAGYTEAHNRVFALVKILEQLPGITVLPVTMPTETKPQATVKATLDDHAVPAGFTLRLTYQPRP